MTFLSDKTRTRRDHIKYLTLIRRIALLHQHQRPIKHIEDWGKQLAYIEVIKNDIVLANRLAHDILGRTLDELPPQTRRLLELLQGWIEARSQAQGRQEGKADSAHCLPGALSSNENPLSPDAKHHERRALTFQSTRTDALRPDR